MSSIEIDLPQSGGGSGTVTGVTASSPLASSGGTAPNISFSNENAHLVLAGPSSGSAAAPTFRALVAGDIPSLSGTYLPLAGGTMSGAIGMGGNNIFGVQD